MENNFKSRSLVEAALMAGITFLLMMMTTLPIFDLIGTFVIPIPITLLYLRHSKKIALLSAVVSGILLGLFYSPFAGLQAIIIYGMIGVTFGYCISKNKSPVKTLSYLIGANFIGLLVQYTLGILMFSNITLKDFLQQVVDTFQEATNMISQLGLNNPATEQVLEIYRAIDVEFLMMILPVIIIIQIIIAAFLNFTITKAILKKLGYKIQSLPKFSNWYIDNRVGAILVMITCLATILRVKEVPYGDTIFVTAYYILIFTFIINGLALVTYFLKNKLKISKGAVVLIGIMVMMSPFGMYLFLLGLIDLLIDIRGVDPNSLGNFIRNKIKTN